MNRAASRICLLCGRITGRYPGRSICGGQENVVVLCRASLLMSTRTGPGRPVEATWNASASARGISDASVTR